MWNSKGLSIFSEIPIVGRLRLRDYIRLCLAFLILVFEPLLRTVSRLLPLRRLQTFLTPTSKSLAKDEAESLQNIEERERLAKTESLFHGLKNTEDFADFWGFACETHYVTTADGYILGLHRIPRAPGDSDNGQKRPVALLWHGFLMCSEIWVCTPDPKLSLAFTLARAGYDVWLGNSRGNKYSQKHRNLKPLDIPFWDFCFEDFAMYDLPNSVDYILRVTDQSSLSYIGFSQGTAQGFAALSLSAELNQKINLFIALAPVTKPVGMSVVCASLTRCSSSLQY